MQNTLKSIAIVFLGAVVLLLGVVIPGHPRAPYNLGGMPRLLYIGVGSAYLTSGGVLYLINWGKIDPTFDQVFHATLFAIPIAVFLSFVGNSMFGPLPAMPELTGGVERSILLALTLHIGTGLLFYPIAFGLAFGIDSESRDRTAVRLIVSYAVGIILLLGLVHLVFGGGGFAGAYAIIGIFIMAIVNIVFAFPLYHIGLRLKPGTLAASN